MILLNSSTVDLETFVAINLTSSKISKRFNVINNLVYEIQYTEITIRLTGIVNGGHLVKPLDWLALLHRKVYRLLKTLLNQVVHLLEYIHSVIVLYTYQYNQVIKESTRLSLVHVIVTYIWHARMPVRYERKMHVLII